MAAIGTISAEIYGNGPLEAEMANPGFWGGEDLVNTTTTGAQEHPQAAALEGGGYVVTWKNFSMGNICAQMFDAFGEPVGAELNVTPGIFFGQNDAHVAGLPGGGFAVSYVGQPNNLGKIVVQTAVFDASGASAGPSVVNEPAAGQSQSYNAIAALDNGGYAVAYMTFDPVAATYSIAVQRFNADGSKLGTEIFVGVDDTATMANPVITNIGDGRFAVAWDGKDDMGDRNVYAQIIGDDGVKHGGVFPVNAEADQQTAPAIAADGSGNFMIGFQDAGAQLGGHILQVLGQLYGSDALPLPTGANGSAGPGQFSDPDANGDFGGPLAMVGVHGGGYLAVWQEVLSGPNVNVIVGQRLDSAGNRVGDEFLIKQASSNAYSFGDIHLTTLADGRVVMTWYDNSGTLGDSDFAIHSQILDPRFGDISGTAAAETLTGSMGIVNDTIDGGDGADTMAGFAGDDTYVIDDAGDTITEALNEGTDTAIISIDYTLEANVENLTIADGSTAQGTGNELNNRMVGNDLANLIAGLAGNDTLIGNGGADTFVGGTGNDSMEGGAGDDTYYVTDAGDVVVEGFNAGNDIVVASTDYTLTGNVEVLSLLAGTNATGNDLANTITGNAAANVIDGKAGADTMTGLTGDDTYVVSDAGDVVVEAANGGTDMVIALFDYTLGDNVETLTLAAGSKATGNALANAIIGNAGDNTLDGQGGADTMTGGLGNDDYIVADAGDVVVEAANGGFDTVHAAFDYTLGANLEALVLGGGAAKGKGNAAANTLTGNALANTLNGDAGTDTIDGGGGKDMLKGGKGNDLLRGQAGADQLWGGAGKDTFDFDAVSDIRKAAGKRDVIKDFEHGRDKIDLSTIDAKSLAAGNQKFKFVAAEGTHFTGVAGQLIWDQKDAAGKSHDVTLVSGDTNGDGIADFTLELSGLVNLTKGDFIL
jgi:Ca2+-binding RTX toxin-like protein